MYVYTTHALFYPTQSTVCFANITRHNAQYTTTSRHLLEAWCSGNASEPISEVTVRRARLVLRWVTECG